jgi:peptide/nickel transport system substrate-binding protein
LPYDAETTRRNLAGQTDHRADRLGSFQIRTVRIPAWHTSGLREEPGLRAARNEPPNWTAGGKVVKVDRVEWITMADPQTALNALAAGDIDFVERLPWDMLSILEKDPSLVVRTLDEAGFQTLGRMNFLHPPFNNVKVRRPALLALRQKDVLDALVGDSTYYRVCGAIYGCDSPYATDIGSETLVKGNGMGQAKKLLAESFLS